MAKMKKFKILSEVEIVGELTTGGGTLTGSLTGNADTATKATQDASGNVITSTYETKADATTKLNNINSQISQLSSEKVDASNISLGIASDGLMYVFVNGQPVGTGIPQSINGDVFGYVDENNTIVLTGNLTDGTYILKYEMENGNMVNIGNMVLDSTVYYSITNTLTECTNSNSIKTIAEGGNYSATITANSGYYMSSIKVTMGGTDITSSTVNGNKITISCVTGNIVITATAVTIPTYTIVKNLTNCAVSNSATSIQQGSAYSATVTANSGYELKSVTVTMDGSAVSVTNGVINIANVTGNIVITAVAEAVITNALETAINADGTPFIGTNGEKGYKTGVRISGTSGNETTQAGCMATGFIAATSDQIVVIENITLHSSTSYNGLVLYDENFAKLINTQIVAGGSTGISNPSNGVYEIRIATFANSQKVRYIRFSCADLSNAVITYRDI